MRKQRTCIATLLLALPVASMAQTPPPRAAQGTQPKQLAFTVERERQPQDLGQLLERNLYPPELIMQNQSRLKITEAQRTVITGEIAKLQTAAVQMQWRVADETQKLLEQLQQPTISEDQALAQVDRLIALENSVKRAQLAMLIRIRNTLTSDQRDMLKEMRSGPIR